MSEVAASPQLAHRDYFREIVTPTGRSISAPGAPYRLSRTPWRVGGPAPDLGSAAGWAS
jgi:benzylsuccinate CoA-transferase BbsE subunit